MYIPLLHNHKILFFISKIYFWMEMMPSFRMVRRDASWHISWRNILIYLHLGYKTFLGLDLLRKNNNSYKHIADIAKFIDLITAMIMLLQLSRIWPLVTEIYFTIDPFFSSQDHLKDGSVHYRYMTPSLKSLYSQFEIWLLANH